MIPHYIVKLKIRRVQTYLFEEPQLKSMIGANSLLGETVRGQLVPDKDPAGFRFAPLLNTDRDDCGPIDNLPALAVDCGAAPPQDAGLQAEHFQLQQARFDRPDPLGDDDRDDPWIAWQHGILIRDAGKFHAVFPSRDQAREFADRAHALISQRLPGILLGMEMTPAGSGPADRRSLGTSLVDLPPFQVCQASGQGPAANSQDDEDGGRQYVSQRASIKRQRTQAFNKGHTYDVLGLMRKSLQAAFQSQDKSTIEFPKNFDEVAPSGYLAVIAADGNGMGQRFRNWCEAASGGSSDFHKHARGERLFLSMRRAVRHALLEALTKTFGELSRDDRPKAKRVLPFRLLMLGGDDLLLVCDAIHAMPLMTAYASQLRQINLEDGSPLTIGAGIAITKRSFPFHRAHALAEQLAGSAKRMYRAAGLQESVVDWLATTEAWHGDIADVRRRHSCIVYSGAKADGPETLILSRKPYVILESEGKPSLESLWKTAVAAQGAPRNQLKELAAHIPDGRRQTDRLASDIALDLGESSMRALSKCVFHRIKQRPGLAWSPWKQTTGDHPAYVTTVLDFLELFELCHRRGKAEQERAKTERASA